jgi:type IV fimbrial biogenesis protein FimT
MRAHLQAGISLVEVLVVVFIVGILIAAGIPSFQTWTQNTQIRTATESMLNGLQAARNEAIRRNVCMQIQLPTDGTTSWAINPCSDPLASPPFMGRAHEEGSPNASIERDPPDAYMVSFNSLGRVIAPNPSDGSSALRNITVRNLTMTGTMAADERKLKIEIPPGGSLRMCDLASTIAADDPRKCS